jgi:two-component system OmpR family response regulator
MSSSQNILIVDDDHEIRSLLAEYLEGHGYHVATASDGVSMEHALQGGHIEIIVLDLTLPGEDGLALCKKLRLTSQVPVIMLTARGESFDRILGLEMGADDYLTKPFEPRELLARIRSVMRRFQVPQQAQSQVRRLTFAGWTLDLTGRHLLNPDGVLVSLSGAEYRLLKVFLDHANQILSRDHLLNLTQGRDAELFDRSIDLQVSRLRQKLAEDARTPQLLKTVRSEGYILACQVVPVSAPHESPQP